ncbi:MAG: ABC transporter permease [Pirellulales bacterium]|nr:ABC transporter permease [Pirellulales bacterium]
MNVACKLTLSYALRHPARMLLTSLAMIASACIVVWVVSGYDALASQFGRQAAEYLGRYDFFIVPEDPKAPFLDMDLVASLQKDPDVAEVTPVTQQPTRVVNPNTFPDMDDGPGGPGRRISPLPLGEGPGVRAGRGQRQSGNVLSAHRPHPNSLPKGEGTGPRRGAPAGGRQGGRPPLRFFVPVSPTLVGTDAASPPYPMVKGTWIDPKHPERRGAVIGKNAAEQLDLKLGDEALVIFGPKEFQIKIAGLIEEGPSQMGMGRRMRPPGSDASRTGIEAGPASSAIYVPLALAKHFTRDQAKINLINVQLKPEAKARTAEFRKKWEVQIAKARPIASLLGVEDIKSGMEEGMMGSRVKQQAWAATGLSLLAALFIIFTTLSMGVTERVRQFAVMRAVGLTRGQVAQVIAAEGILLALIGWGGGLLAGWALLAFSASRQPGLFSAGATVGLGCILFTGLSSLGGALAGSLLPAWRSMSVQPLEVLSPHRLLRPNCFWTVFSGAVGLALIAVNPILVFVAPSSFSLDSDNIYYIYMAVGCTTMAVGFLLLTPATIVIVERLLGPVVAWILRFEPRLLRNQLGSNLWRTLGTTTALTVGLGLFVSMQIWGYSMLEPFKPGDWNPDVLVSLQRGGLPDAEIRAVQATAGIRAGRCIPLAVEQPKLASDITGSEGRQSVIQQNNVIMIGLDPEAALSGDDPLLDVKFVEGSAKEAIAKLKQGRYCIVPDHFLRATKLKLGDSFSLIPPNLSPLRAPRSGRGEGQGVRGASPIRTVKYTIIGAVKLPGWHWMTKFSGLRKREGRSAAMVFANYDDVQKDFALRQVNFFWMDVDPGYGAKHMDEAVQVARRLKDEAKAHRPTFGPPTEEDKPLDAQQAAVLLVGDALQKIAERHPGEKQPVNMQGTWTGPAIMFGESVRITTPEIIFDRITGRAGSMIWASCTLPLVTLLITSLGVVNTVMASVRARRWEFGVLRSQGVTRWGLFRMILAEGLLIGLITCVLSLGFGVFSGWCGTGISQYVSFFGGLNPPLVIPWLPLAFGFGLTLLLCLAAALYPAVATGRTEPLRLLQEGRAAL